jgi:hypothetical protein
MEPPQDVLTTTTTTTSLPAAFQDIEPLLDFPPPQRTDKLTRSERFDALFEFVEGGLGLPYKRAVPSRGIRNAFWNRLFTLAETQEHLERVVELFPKWREMDRSFRPRHAEMFVRAYNYLGSPRWLLINT